MNQTKRAAIFKRLKALNPKPTTELIHHNHFQLLIAVILSAQATDVSVNKVTPTLFGLAPTPADMLLLGETKLLKIIKSIGLYKSKAAHIIKTCKMLVEQYNSQVPNDFAALVSLPGVGRKTANVVLNTAFGVPTIAVDTHIYRLANRTKLAPGKSVLAVEKKLMRVIPEAYRHDAHHWLILHGRYICTARNPKCGECPLYDLCEYQDKSKFADRSS